jgi:hypothetical protein
MPDLPATQDWSPLPEPFMWQFEVPEKALPEIQTMTVIVKMFEHLEDDEVWRVLNWAVDRFRGASGSTGGAA